MYIRICSVLVMSLFVALPLLVGAETYTPLTDTLGFREASAAAEQGDFADIINIIYRIAIGAGTMLAVIMIIIAGFTYAATSVANKKSDMKQRITLALGGLALLVGAYVLLRLINPQLTDYEEIGLDPVDYDGVTVNEEINFDAVARDTDVTMGIRSETELEQYMTNPTEEQYVEMFGQNPVPHRVQNGRVLLTSEEQRQLMQQIEERARNGGITAISNDEFVQGTRCVTANKDLQVNVPDENIAMVAYAIRNACSTGPRAIPSEWAFNENYYKLVACESSGQIGRLNGFLERYAQAQGHSYEQITQDIRSDTFYQKHCCRLKNSSNSSLSQRVTSEPNGASCNPGTMSGLMDYNQQIGNNRGCTSAAGFGQLLVINMEIHQPDGVRGFADTGNEICGQLHYIKERYGSPDQAWVLHNEDKNGDGVVSPNEEGY